MNVQRRESVRPGLLPLTLGSVFFLIYVIVWRSDFCVFIVLPSLPPFWLDFELLSICLFFVLLYFGCYVMLCVKKKMLMIKKKRKCRRTIWINVCVCTYYIRIYIYILYIYIYIYIYGWYFYMATINRKLNYNLTGRGINWTAVLRNLTQEMHYGKWSVLPPWNTSYIIMLNVLMKIIMN